ncbi:MAG TPA: adenylate/guanylate cyclase domain-containing protein [Acidimicrobiales bacterium]
MNCPSCGALTPDGARFCPSCGRLLTAGRAEERRVVTVLFADLVGYTGFSENLDPEQVKRLVDGCFQRLVTEITSYGGRVDKIVGDAIMALFGAPVAHEDDAERAVRAALRMQQSLAEHAGEQGLVIQMRIGVNTGEVLVGALRAGGDYTAMGDVVNIASRLQTQAAPGTVVVGPATHAATELAIRYEPLGEIVTRGREELVEAWLAVEAMTMPGQRRRRTRTPLIGRDTERALLMDGVRLAFRHGRPFLAVVDGEGGVGKNRLLESLGRDVTNTLGGKVLNGRCVPYGEPNPWWPIAQAMWGHFGPDVTTDVAAAQAAAIELVAEMLGVDRGDPEVRRIVDGLLHLAALPSHLDVIDPGRAREELTRSVLAVLEIATHHTPVVLMIADLQWAQPQVLELLDRVVTHLAGRPFALVTSLRSDRDLAWPPAGGRHTCLMLRLDPLDEASAEQLARVLLPEGTPANVRELLLERAGGNPFFLEELAALVLPDGAMPELPDTLRGLVAARLDALSPDERAMLENAAVLGSSGNWMGLAHFGQAMGQQPQRATLTALAEAELIDVDGQRWSFRSESVREVAYATLTKTARAQRHAGVAVALQESAGPRSDRAEAIGFHWATAADLARELGPIPGVPSDAGRRAVMWLGRAAHWSLEQEALPNAIRLATEALELVAIGEGDSADRRNLLLVRGEAHAEARDLVNARLDAEAALESALEIDDEAGTAQAQVVLALADRGAGHLDSAHRRLADALVTFRRLGDKTRIAHTQREVGMTAIFSADFELAEAALADAEDIYEQLGDRRGRAWVDQHEAWVSFVQGDLDEVEARLAKAAETFRELGDRGGLGWVNGLLAYLRYMQGRFGEAEELGTHVLTEAGERGDRWAAAMMETLLAGLSLWRGDTERGRELAAAAHSKLRALGDRFGEVQAAAPHARAMVATGRIDEALRLVEELGANVGQFGMERFADTVAAAVGVHAGLPARAEPFARQALEHVDESGFSYEALVALGLTRLQQADIDGALVALEQATAILPTHPYAQSATALVLAASAKAQDALLSAHAVLESSMGTYLDRTMAGCAAVLASAQLGGIENVRQESSRLIAIVDATGDRVAQALARLARAEALEQMGDPAAPDARAGAESLAGAIQHGLPGWRVALHLAAVGAGTPTVPVAQ